MILFPTLTVSQLMESLGDTLADNMIVLVGALALYVAIYCVYVWFNRPTKYIYSNPDISDRPYGNRR